MTCEIIELFEGQVSEKEFGDLERVRGFLFSFPFDLLQVEIYFGKRLVSAIKKGKGSGD